MDKGFSILVEGKRIGWVEEPYFLIDRIGVAFSLYNYIEDYEQKKDISSEHLAIIEKMKKGGRAFLQLSLQQSVVQDVNPKVR